jgi:hypothetical protein
MHLDRVKEYARCPETRGKHAHGQSNAQALTRGQGGRVTWYQGNENHENVFPTSFPHYQPLTMITLLT